MEIFFFFSILLYLHGFMGWTGESLPFCAIFASTVSAKHEGSDNSFKVLSSSSTTLRPTTGRTSAIVTRTVKTPKGELSEATDYLQRPP